MDTTETPTPTDLELATMRAIELDANDADTNGFGSEVTKTLAISTATSVVLFGGYAVASALLPKVRAWFASRKKNANVIVDAENLVTIEDPITEKD